MQMLSQGFKHLLFQVTVTGESCWPKLVPGKKYLASRLFKPKTGDFIVFPNPEHDKETFVKRIRTIQPNGYEVEGLVSWATSSKQMGLIPKENILGKLLFVS